MCIRDRSRFGKEEWLKPYSDDTVRELVGEGIERLDVICPGFHTDCLETIEEIGLELKETWQKAGGQSFHYIQMCIRDRHRTVLVLLCKTKYILGIVAHDRKHFRQQREVSALPSSFADEGFCNLDVGSDIRTGCHLAGGYA